MNTEFKGVIYITTCLINGKKYIGKDQINRPGYLGSGKIFKQALAKYGKENFIKEILAEGKDPQDLRDLEKYYISYYGAQTSDLFYNISPGGDGGNVCDQSHKKIPINQYDRMGNFLKTWESAADAAVQLNIHRTKIVSSYSKHKSAGGFIFKKVDDNSPITIPKFRSETKRKQVYQYNSDMTQLLGEFKSVSEAEKETGVSRRNIYDSIKGKIQNPTYRWIIVGTQVEYSFKNQTKENKKIYQYKLDGSFVKSYNSLTDIPKDLKDSNLSTCLSGKRKSCKGFIWSYELRKQNYKRAEYGSNSNYAYKTTKPRIKSKLILVYTIDNQFIEESTVSKIVDKYGIHATNIWKVLKGERIHTKNLTFKYKEE